MFKVNNKDTRKTSLTSFWCLYCLLWTYFTPFLVFLLLTLNRQLFARHYQFRRKGKKNEKCTVSKLYLYNLETISNSTRTFIWYWHFDNSERRIFWLFHGIASDKCFFRKKTWPANQYMLKVNNTNS